MLTQDELTTIRAALLFWQEEICPHEPNIGRPYFDAPIEEPLSAEAVSQLRSELSCENIRYGICKRDHSRISTPVLFKSWEKASKQSNDSTVVATILLPRDK